MYFITTIDSKDGDTRCVGYYKTFKEAERVVTNNECDIYETCYDYAIIEHIKEGLYQYDYHPTWYKYQSSKAGYVKTDIPAFANSNNIGYAIG